jgi:PAS domain S-box-containing protein
MDQPSAQRVHDAQQALFHELARGRSLSDTLAKLVLTLESAVVGTMGSVLLVQDRRLRTSAGPSLNEAFLRAADGHPIGEGFGSCGTAAHRQQTVIVDDIETDPLWDRYRALAQRYGIAACWSTPVFHPATGAVLGTVALYCPQARRPSSVELQQLRDHAQTAAVLIDYDRMRLALTGQQQHFGDLVDDLGVITWEASGDEVRLTCVSRQAERQLGWALGTMRDDLGAWERLIHPDDRAVVLRRQREAMRRGGDYECEHRLQAADGSAVWVRNVVSVDAADGDGHRLRGVMVDISGQREVERERERLVRHLAEERSFLRKVIEQLPEPISIVGLDGEILIANRALTQLWNVRVPTDVRMQEEFKDFTAFFPDGRPYRVEDWPLSRLLRTGEAVPQEEMQYLDNDGVRRSMLVNAEPIRDETGKMIAGVSVSEDITERKRSENLRRLLFESGSILAGSRDVVVTARSVAMLAVKHFAEWAAIVTAAEGGDLKCIALEHRDPAQLANLQTIDHLLDTPGDGFLRIRAVIDSGKAELITQPFAQEEGAAGESGAAEAAVAKVRQTLGEGSVITVPLTTPTRALGVLIFGAGKLNAQFRPSDIPLAEELSRRVALSLENARLFAEAQRAIRHREEFLSIAAHELRTPLASLRLTVQTIDDQLARPVMDLDFLRARAKAGERYTGRLDRLIRELLDVAVIQTGRLRLAHEEMDLIASAESVIASMREELTAKGIDLVLHGQGPLMGWWDPARIDQIITNLLSNAIKYGQRQPVRVFVEASDNEAVLEVEDEGMGISAEILPRLFQPFERGVAPGHFGGLGLGLHITDQIVRAHGGTISVRSAEGRGSTFTVRLPIRMPS